MNDDYKVTGGGDNVSGLDRFEFMKNICLFEHGISK